MDFHVGSQYSTVIVCCILQCCIVNEVAEMKRKSSLRRSVQGSKDDLSSVPMELEATSPTRILLSRSKQRALRSKSFWLGDTSLTCA